jgi:hypothetical protein
LNAPLIYSCSFRYDVKPISPYHSILKSNAVRTSYSSLPKEMV